MKKRIVSLVLALCVLISVSALAAYDAGPLLGEMKTAAEKAASAVEKQAFYSSWNDVLALCSSGAKITLGKLPEESVSSVSGIATTILVRIATGKDPYAGGLPYDLAVKQAGDGSFGYINEHIYAMLALDRSMPGGYHAGKAMDWLEAQQLSDGGFTYAGDTGDIDLTGMALLVLKGGSAEKAAAFLASKLTANGGYIPSWSETQAESACSVATAISGLIAAGRTVDEKMKENLLSFQLSDGSFCNEKGGTSDIFATQQCLMALGELINGQSVYSRLEQTDGDMYRDWSSIAVWARESAKAVFKKDLMVGDENRNFNPLKNVNRAELAVVASKILGMSGKSPALSDQGVKDVTLDSWYYSHVTKVLQAGVMTAGKDGFGPYTQVTREEMALVIYRLLGLTPGTTRPEDADEVGQGYMDAVSAVIDEGIMVGNGIIFMPKSRITRQEVATIIAKIVA